MFNPRKIPSDLGNYLAGFTDGEGSFNVSFRQRKDYKIPWKISLCFNISQKDQVILYQFKKHLKCGSIRERKNDGRIQKTCRHAKRRGLCREDSCRRGAEDGGTSWDDQAQNVCSKEGWKERWRGGNVRRIRLRIWVSRGQIEPNR